MNTRLQKLYKTLKPYTPMFLLDKQYEADATAHVLKQLIDTHGHDFMEHREAFYTKMHEHGCTNMQIQQLLMMQNVTGFETLIAANRHKENVVLEMFIQNALSETGLHRSIILQLVNQLAYAYGFAYVYDEAQKPLFEYSHDAFTVPMRIYQQELEAFDQAFSQYMHHGEKLNFEQLEPLVQAGLPKALYYKGYYLLQKDTSDAIEQGIQLLKQSAEAGELQASVALGDYYYKKNPTDWNQAYYYYTRHGAMALNDQRSEAMEELFMRRTENRTLFKIQGSWLFVIIMGAMIAPLGSSSVFSILLKILFVFVEFYIYAKSYVRFKKQPFELSTYTPILMFLIWICYILAQLQL